MEIKICDVCREQPNPASLSQVRMYAFEYDNWWGATAKRIEMCLECRDKIFNAPLNPPKNNQPK